MDKHIVYDMQMKFPENWALTSSHTFRESDDMQFSFSYFHFLMVSQPGIFVLRCLTLLKILTG